MKRYLIPILLAILVLASGALVGCAAGLPEDETFSWYAMGDMEGYQCGHWLAVTDKDYPALWITPDRVDKVQQLYETNIREVYIPKGYLTMEDFANAHFTDGTPYNNKQKEQALEGHNWGFYDGFCQGVDDGLHGRPSRYYP